MEYRTDILYVIQYYSLSFEEDNGYIFSPESYGPLTIRYYWNTGFNSWIYNEYYNTLLKIIMYCSGVNREDLL